MKRIGILQVWQESNTFNPVLTTVGDFESFRPMGYGQEGLNRFAQGEEVRGFVQGLERRLPDARAVGLAFAQAWCGGPLAREAETFLADQIREQLKRAGRLDGVLCSLHGALAAEDNPDVDGRLLAVVRQAIGPDTPLVATLDLHAHLMPQMIASADALVAYHTSPHIDRMQTGERAAAVLERILLGAAPRTVGLRLPMSTSGEFTRTDTPPMAAVFERLARMEGEPGVLSASVLMCQPWLDVPDAGWAVCVVTDADQQAAEDRARELATMCWQRRDQLVGDFLDARESVLRALAFDGKPVVIADGADATNSGACGDSVHLLRELMRHPIPEGALTFMVDPQAVAYARAVGQGGAFDFAVGGKRDVVFSQPLRVQGTVLSLQPARYVLSGHLADHLPVDMGQSAVVETGDVTLLLVERPGPGSSPLLHRCVGLEPKDFKIVVVKSPAGFRADYEPFAAGIVLSATPGCASPRLADLPFRRVSRPLWPLDDLADPREATWAGRLDREE